MKNPLDTVKKWFILSFLVLALPGITLLGQEGDGGGGGSAAEAAVTSGGASTPAAAASGSTESNPVVTLVRAGLGFQNAKAIKIEDVKTIALAGGSLGNLVKSAVNIEKGDWQAADLVTLIKVGVDFESTASTLDLVKEDKLILTDVTALISSGLDITDATSTAKDIKLEKIVLSDITTLLGKGKLSLADVLSSALSIKNGDTTLDTVSSLIDAGLSAEDIAGATASGSTTNTALLISTRALTTNDVLYAATQQVISASSTDFTGFQSYLEGAVTFANTVLTDVTITSAAHVPTEISIASLTASPQTTEFIRLLAKYGAIGSDPSVLSDSLAAAFFGTNYDYAGFTGSASLIDFLGSNTSDHVGQLKTSLGTRTLPSGVQNSTVLQVAMSNVTLAPGANITVGASGSTSTIDVSDVLTKANSNEERKVAILGAAKDLTIAGDVIFTNTNSVEDHALVLGAADDVYFRSEYSTANSADYDSPDPITVKYTGSNLGIGSNDSMRLINVNMETGGNLALASLDELHIGTTSSHSSTFSVGTGGQNSDPDNVYLYANNLISINGLQLSGNVDDVYMDAITIDLSNVTFPQNSDVMLRSKNGSMSFGSANRAVGSVNFIQNVKYGATAIESAGQFNGADGHWDSTELSLPNGKSAIKVRGF